MVHTVADLDAALKLAAELGGPPASRRPTALEPTAVE
jgi:hypothetical protein